MQHNILRITSISPLKVITTLISVFILSSLASTLYADTAFQYNDELINLANKFDDPAARYLVGRRFYKGTDYPQDKRKAAYWYELAANSGHIKAQYYLGRMYSEGDGVKQNYNLGKKYLKLAAKQKHLDSMVALADLYRRGINGQKINHKHAVFWYKKAAKLDDTQAAYYLGVYMYEGKGIKQQKNTGLEWIELAADFGFSAAKNYLENIAGKNTAKLSDFVEAISTNSNRQKTNSRSTRQSNSSIRTKQTNAFKNEFSNNKSGSHNKFSGINIDELDLREANNGNVDSQYNVGMELLESNTNLKTAAKWLRLAAEQDHTGAQYQLGIMYRDSIGVRKSESEAIKWLRLASSWGVSAAQRALDKLLRKQLIESEDELFRQNPELKDPDAQYTLGVMYTIGEGVEHDPQSAIQWLQKAALQNHSEAQYRLGEIYRKGDGVDTDYYKARVWLSKAAKLGNGRAKSSLQHILSNEEQRLVDEQSSALANSPVYKIIYEAKRGKTTSQYKIGLMYLTGEDIAKDIKKGIMWLERAAENSSIPAQLALGELYFSGKKLNKDYKKAYRWYRYAADAGAPDAQYQLGSMFRKGYGVKKNNSQAVKWFRLAARQGHTRAQQKLGGCRIC